MNRLNLMKMVNKKMNNSGENKFFRSTEIDLKDYYDSERYNRKIEVDRKQHIEEKINYIMAQVHHQLNNRKPSAPKPAIKTEKSTEKSPEKALKKKKRVTMADDLHPINCDSLAVEGNTGKKEKSNIPRLKAICYRKSEKRIPHPTPQSNNFNSEKRVRDVLKHNAILENMLEEHKQLREDRQSIAQEITAMRGNLDGIRGRLNSSIKKLDEKKTYCELHGLSSCKSCKKSSVTPKKEPTKLSEIKSNSMD